MTRSSEKMLQIECDRQAAQIIALEGHLAASNESNRELCRRLAALEVERDKLRQENARLRSALDPRSLALIVDDGGAKVARGLPGEVTG